MLASFGIGTLAATRRSARAALIFDRLTFRANARNHRAHLSYAHAIRDLNLDLILVDDFRHLADQSPCFFPLFFAIEVTKNT